MATKYTGNTIISGSITDSLGDSATASGTLGITLSATLDSHGTGTAAETIRGNLYFQYSYVNGYSGTDTRSLNLTTPSFAIQTGIFQFNEPASATILGVSLDLTLSGSVSVDRTTISSKVSATFSGTYNGVSISGTVGGSSTLTEPKSTLPVSVGGTAIISHDFLWSFDTDKLTGAYGDPATITYAITEPTHGTVLLDGSPTDTFTQAELDNKRVQYRENGDVATSDGFTFTVSDPFGNTITEPYAISIVNTTAPVIQADETLSVAPTDPTTIWTNSLNTVALNDDPTQVIYSVITGPAHGSLLFDGAPTASFTQYDIDNHQIEYLGSGDGSAADSFSFQVTDAAGDKTAVTTFSVKLQDSSAASQEMGVRASSLALLGQYAAAGFANSPEPGGVITAYSAQSDMSSDQTFLTAPQDSAV
jgi:hypothetical protein